MSVATTAATSSSDDFDSFAFELDDVHETDVLVDVNESHLSMMTSVTSLVSQSNGRSRKNQPNNPEMSESEKRRFYRIQQKDTRQSLKLQERELTEALTDLREKMEKQKSELLSSRTPAYCYWESTACREKQQRFQAEADKQQLYAAISLQSSYIDNLRGILGKRYAGQEESRKKLCLASSEPALVDAYIRKLEDNYTRAEEVFRNSGLSSVPESEVALHSVHTRDSDEQVEYFQQLNKMVQPFTLRETGQSLWGVGETQHSYKPNYQRSYDVGDPENTIAAKFVESKTLQSGETAPLVQRFIARRFEDESCIIHTWKFITEGAGVFNGMQADETGWCRLLPSTDVTEPGTQIEICIRRVPMHFKSVQSRRSKMTDFYEALQAVSAVTLNEVMTSLEDLLLDDLLTGIV